MYLPLPEASLRGAEDPKKEASALVPGKAVCLGALSLSNVSQLVNDVHHDEEDQHADNGDNV